MSAEQELSIWFTVSGLIAGGLILNFILGYVLPSSYRIIKYKGKYGEEVRERSLLTWWSPVGDKSDTKEQVLENLRNDIGADAFKKLAEIPYVEL